jgi:hypothetical protein
MQNGINAPPFAGDNLRDHSGRRGGKRTCNDGGHLRSPVTS